MREIKFRAWFNGKKRMVYNLGFDDRSFTTLDDPTLQENEMPSVWDKDCIIDDSYYEGAFSYEIMQYTGLKDKNGIEIYEGDIILAYKDYKYVVKFSTDRGGWFPFATDDGCGCCAEEIANNESAEVIGNIWESPELLEVAND